MLARTLAAQAFGAATVALAQQTGVVQYMRWSLSSSHRRVDTCCPAGTLIHTIDGRRPIETIQLGDLVLTHQGRYRKVSRLYQHTIQEGSLCELCYRGEKNRRLRLLLTPNHPVLTARGWTQAEHLHTGERLCGVPQWLSQFSIPYAHGGMGTEEQSSAKTVTLQEKESSAVAQCDAELHA